MCCTYECDNNVHHTFGHMQYKSGHMGSKLWLSSQHLYEFVQYLHHDCAKVNGNRKCK